jgi:predicted metal-dependent HD superfamily phosphohydrolase
MNIGYLNSKWDVMWYRLGAQGNGDVVFDDLVYHYSLPNRHYHNLDHIERMLSELDSIRDSVVDVFGLEWMIWFHDSIYDPLAHDNEEKSAHLASARGEEAGFDSWTRNFFFEGILSTKTHAPDGNMQAHLITLDLAILGSSEEEYDAYEMNIFREYAAAGVSKEAFVAGRLAWAEGFVVRKPMYHTVYGIETYQDQAIANLKRSIERLQRGELPG